LQAFGPATGLARQPSGWLWLARAGSARRLASTDLNDRIPRESGSLEHVRDAGAVSNAQCGASSPDLTIQMEYLYGVRAVPNTEH